MIHTMRYIYSSHHTLCEIDKININVLISKTRSSSTKHALYSTNESQHSLTTITFYNSCRRTYIGILDLSKTNITCLSKG